MDYETTFPASLAGYRLVLALPPTIPFTASQQQAMTAFEQAGGTLVLIGENAALFSDQDATINTFLTQLGLGTHLQLNVAPKDDVGDSSCRATSATNSSNPFAAGVTSLDYLVSATLTADPSTVIASADGGVLLASYGNVVLSGDSNIFAPINATGCPAPFDGEGDNATFFANLWNIRPTELRDAGADAGGGAPVGDAGAGGNGSPSEDGGAAADPQSVDAGAGGESGGGHATTPTNEVARHQLERLRGGREERGADHAARRAGMRGVQFAPRLLREPPRPPLSPPFVVPSSAPSLASDWAPLRSHPSRKRRRAAES